MYTYRYPESMGGAIFYVGKGKTYWDGYDRIDDHEKEAKGEKHPNNLKKIAAIKEIWAAGEEVVKRKEAFFANEKDAYLYEWALINMTTYAESLTNIGRGKGHSRGPCSRGIDYQKYGTFCIQRYNGQYGHRNYHLATYHKVSDIRSFCAFKCIKQKMFLEVLDGKSASVRGYSLIPDCDCVHQSMTIEREYALH